MWLLKCQVSLTRSLSLGKYLDYCDYWIENIKISVKDDTRLIHKEIIEAHIKYLIVNYLLTEYSLADYQQFYRQACN